MAIELGPDLEAYLRERARQEGTTPEELARVAVHEKYPAVGQIRRWKPRDEWEERLQRLSVDTYVTPSSDALARESFYD